MIDIIYRLRRYAGGMCISTTTEIEAADIIEGLRAKIEAMEKQEPAGTVQWINGLPLVNVFEGVILEPNKPLYAAPGAQGEEE